MRASLDVGDASAPESPVAEGIEPRPAVVLPLALFALTGLSTALSGAMQSPEAARAPTSLDAALFALHHVALGVPYAVALMAILVAHEAGHAILARRHGVPASLPHFIPLPFTVVGTMGAVIGLRAEVRSRNALVDIAAAGPFAGLAVALPVLALGIHWSTVGPSQPGDLVEGQSLLYIGLKLLVKGELLPAHGRDLTLHPVAFAGWVGLLVTAINLLPIGPLDGGHLAAAALGEGHARRSRFVHRLLPAVGLFVSGVFAVLAARAGHGGRALSLGLSAGLPWFVWSGVLLVLRRLSGGAWQEPIGTDPLTAPRKALVIAAAIAYLLLFMPWVLREGL